MAPGGKLCWLVLLTLSGLSAVAVSGQLINFLAFMTEEAVAAFMDINSPVPLQTTGVNSLDPTSAIRIHCARPSVAYFDEIFPNDTALTSKINFTKPVAVVTHGWTEGTNITSFVTLSTRYRQFVDTNVCMLDWQPYAAYVYGIAARTGVPLAAQRLAQFLTAIASNGFPLGNVSLVGFSMGGQIVGLGAKNFSGRVGTIYALDPAGPLFTLPFDVGTAKRIATTDAQYVQQIATSRYMIGMGPLIGDENFLPNGGYHPQPGCTALAYGGSEIAAIICSHEYAVTWFSQTLDPSNVVTGRKCSNLLGVLLCVPGVNQTDRMGIYANRLAGSFYV